MNITDAAPLRASVGNNVSTSDANTVTSTRSYGRLIEHGCDADAGSLAVSGDDRAVAAQLFEPAAARDDRHVVPCPGEPECERAADAARPDDCDLHLFLDTRS